MVVIIGAGLTGLACAHQLRSLGIPHVVLERSDRPGGVIRSGRVDGHLLEWGPQRTRLTEGFRELARELGIEAELIVAPTGLPLYVYRDGRLRLVPFSPADYLRSDLLTWRGKLRLLAEPLSAGPRDEESVADFLTRKLGREAYENLVGPLYGGLYASDPADMLVRLSLAHALREFGIERSLLLPLARRGGRISPPPACSFREGMQTLPRALLEHNEENVRLEADVRSIRRGDSGGYLVEFGGECVSAEHVVITVDAPAAADLLGEISPSASAAVGNLAYNPLAIVHLLARTDLRGLGYQVSFAERSVTRGVTFNESLFGRTGVYTAFLGGARFPGITSWPEGRIRETAAEEFRRMTGFAAEPLSMGFVRMPAWDRTWQALDGLELPPRVHVAANWESRPGIPGRLLRAKRLAVLLAGEIHPSASP